MKRTLKCGLSVWLAALLLVPVIPAYAADVSDPNSALTAPSVTGAERAKTLTEKYGVTSVQYAVMENGKITQSGHAGVYSKTENRALTNETLYGIGSTSKMFTTAAVMTLVDAGKIDLDKPVTDYIPEFIMADDRYQQITVRMLLNHSSGLLGSTMNDAFLYGNQKTRDAYTTLLDDLKTQRLAAEPGAFSVYCNDGFTLAELVVERVSGMSFTAYVHKTITEPLKMEHTFTPEDTFDRKDMARAYDTVDPSVELTEEITHVIGTGGVLSTAEDLCRFGTLFTGESKILSEASRKATFEKEYLRGQWLADEPNSIGYGLGWDTVNLPPFDQYDMQAVCKGGDTITMHASLIVLPEQKLSVAVVSSGSSSLYNGMVAKQLALEQLKTSGKIAEILPQAAVGAITAQELDQDFSKYEGLYGSLGAMYHVTIDADGQLNLTNAYDSTAKQQLKYIGSGRFSDRYGINQYYFVEQEGKTYLAAESRSILPAVGEAYSDVYAAQKLPTYPMPADARDAWMARNGKTYVQVNARYDSENLMSLPAAGILIDESLGGYLINTRIVDANTAQAVLQIPMMAGRDQCDYTFFTENGVEYMQGRDMIMMDVSKVPALYAGGSHAHLTIPENGYGRWFTVGEALDGKTITVTLPEDSGFALYGPVGTLINQSAATKTNSATLQAGGYLYFAGPAGTRIDMDFT